MSVPQQLNVHSLFQTMPLFDGTEDRGERKDDDESCQHDNIPQLVLSNLTGSSSDFDGNPYGGSVDKEDEESSASSADDSSDSDDDSVLDDAQPHYPSRLEATQKLIRDCVITAKTISDPNIASSASHQSFEEDTFFPIDVPAREPVHDRTVRTCFESVHLFSPTYFAGLEKHDVVVVEHGKQDTVASSRLSCMIHPMSFASLATPSCDNDKTRNTPRPSKVTPLRTPKAEIKRHTSQSFCLEREEEEGGYRQPRLQSAFKSSMAKESIEYCLSTGKKGMTRQLRRETRNLLPENLSERMVQKKSDKDSNLTKDGASFDNNNLPTRSLHLAPDSRTSLSILLLECHQKVFEIVAVDHVTAETSVGDVLSRARSQATDPRLSRQTYVSLCNAVHEMAAMMLPVHLMLLYMSYDDDSSTNKRGRGELTLKKYDRLEAASKTCDDPSLGRLLVAVPEGSTAETVREIQKALWCHPRIQRWWKKENRFSGKKESETKREEIMY